MISLFSSPPLSRLTSICIALFFFCSSLYVFTRNNDFPFYCHPDERGKAAQVLDNVRNFHHPLLMLTTASLTTRVIKDWQNRKPTYQETVEIGRWVAAVFVSGGVAVLALTLLHTSGLFAALAVGLVLTLDPTLFFLSHYMKENSTLIFSLSLLFLTHTFFNRLPNLRNTAFLGAAMGLVGSSKYTGLISLAVVLPFLIIRLRQHRAETNQSISLLKSVGIFTAAMLGVFLVFNYPMIIQAKTFLAGFGRELTEVTVGQHGVRKTQVPHIAYLRFLYNNFPLWYWPILGGYFFLAWRLPNRQRMEYLFPALIALAVLGMISFSPKISEKYMMPAEIFVLFAICAAVGVLAKWRPVRFPWMGSTLAVILVGLIVREQWQGNTTGRLGLKDAKDSFATNSYQILNDWILSNLPTTAILLQPEKRFLPDPEIGFFDDIPKKFPQKIYSQSTFVKSGSISSARAVGVTHVVVLYGTTKKYEGKVVSATQEAIIDRTRRSKFFNELLQNSRLVYKLEPRKNILLHPGFEIYELNSPSST